MDLATVRRALWAASEGTKRYYQYVHINVEPVLQGLDASTTYISVLIDLYMRIHLFMRSLTKLDEAPDFQVVRSIARSMFEVLLDIKALQANPSLSERLSHHPRIERMRTAIKVRDFVAKNRTPEREEKYKLQIALANNTDEIHECQRILRDIFGKTTDISVDGARHLPLTWSQTNVREHARVSSIDDELDYLAGYSKDSWFVHGGLAGIANVPELALVNACCKGHLKSQATYHAGNCIISTELGLSDRIPGLSENLDRHRDMPQLLFSDPMP
jgi:hypothetical protein